jgi:MFS transporter, ACS family, allantoate permease
VREAVLDTRLWLVNLYILVNCITNGAVTAFGPLVVNGFGYSTFQTTLLGMPIGATQVAGLWIAE